MMAFATGLKADPSRDWWGDTYRAGLLSTRPTAALVEESKAAPAPERRELTPHPEEDIASLRDLGLAGVVGPVGQVGLPEPGPAPLDELDQIEEIERPRVAINPERPAGSRCRCGHIYSDHWTDRGFCAAFENGPGELSCDCIGFRSRMRVRVTDCLGTMPAGGFQFSNRGTERAS